jgi:hypothetical protein
MTARTAMCTTVLALALVTTAACGRPTRPTPEAKVRASSVTATTRDEPCRPGRGTKLGQPFARVCPDPEDPHEPAFWIHAAPVPCSAGEHGEIECPTVTPLLAPENGVAVARFASMGTPLVDASTAHRLCAMRFAGRLPTRRERARARDSLGLTTLSVVESKGSAGAHFDFRQVPEWVTEIPCDQPSVLGPECGATREPPESTTQMVGFTEWICDAEFVGATNAPILAVGESCPSGAFDPGADRRLLPCAASIAVESGALSTRFGFELRCRVSAASPRSAGPRRDPAPDPAPTEVAAMRCVVPVTLLDSHTR